MHIDWSRISVSLSVPIAPVFRYATSGKFLPNLVIHFFQFHLFLIQQTFKFITKETRMGSPLSPIIADRF